MHPGDTPNPGQQPHSVPPGTPAQPPATPTSGPPAQVSPSDLAKALNQAERQRGRRKLRRRALLAGTGVVATAAVCAGAVEFGPGLLQKAGEYTKAELAQAFQEGIQEGRQAVLNELKQLEGISIEAAIDVAGVTQFTFDKLIIPLSQLTVTITGDALEVLANAVQSARTNLARINVTIGLLDNIQQLLTQWRNNLPDPTVLNAYASYTDAQIQGAETYLRALQKRINAPETSTPSPTK